MPLQQVTIEAVAREPKIQLWKHHVNQQYWPCKTEIGWLNLFGCQERPYKGLTLNLNVVKETWKDKATGAERATLWADIGESGPVSAPQPPPTPVKAPDLGPSPYSTGYNGKREEPAQPTPIGNLIPRQPDNRIPWADLERVARQAHLLAVQLEPDHQDDDIFDRSSARFAFTNTILIAYTSNKLQPPPLAEDVDPFAGDAIDDEIPPNEDQIIW